MVVSKDGRVSLSTLHREKGSEYDAVTFFGVNAGAIPSRRDQKTLATLHGELSNFENEGA